MGRPNSDYIALIQNTDRTFLPSKNIAVCALESSVEKLTFVCVAETKGESIIIE